MDKGEVLDRWKQFFNEHLNGKVAQLGAPAADEQFPVPDLATMRKETRQLLKNNRAAGKDRSPGELFQ